VSGKGCNSLCLLGIFLWLLEPVPIFYRGIKAKKVTRSISIKREDVNGKFNYLLTYALYLDNPFILIIFS